MTVGYKGIFVLFSLFCATLLSGCVTTAGGTDVTALASSLPQVQEFLDQYPDAKISVALWDSVSVEKNISAIRADCGEQFAVGDYYKVSVIDPSFTLVVWLDKSSQNVMCAVKAASANPTYVPTGTPTQLPSSTVVPAASAIPTVSTEFPPMPPEEQAVSSASATPAASTEFPPMPPGSEGNVSEGLTYEEYECTRNGGWWNTCASPCEGREDAACIQMCVAKCEYANRTVTPTPASGSCVTVGRSVPVVANPPKCCEGLVLNASAVPAGVDGISGYCTYPVPQVAEGCKWVGIECSHKGAYWTGKPMECNKANEGLVGMGPSGNVGGAYMPESYTSEEWDTCFTPRAMCDCGNATVPTPAPSPSPTPVPVVVNCTDSDGGLNYYQSGYVRILYSNSTVRYISDFCSQADSNVVFDMYCNGTAAYASQGYVCPNGCSDGACVASIDASRAANYSLRLSALVAGNTIGFNRAISNFSIESNGGAYISSIPYGGCQITNERFTLGTGFSDDTFASVFGSFVDASLKAQPKEAYSDFPNYVADPSCNVPMNYSGVDLTVACRTSDCFIGGDVNTRSMDFASVFRFYLLHGPEFRALVAAQGSTSILAQKYAWMKENVFAGKEFSCTDLMSC